jgi:nucleoside-diphosphate-sugar epimerase
MSKTALIVGGTGQIGLAAARRLLATGWRLRLAQRSAARLPDDLAGEVDTVAADRDSPGALAAAVGGGADALIDTVAYDETHARQLLEVEADVGTLVVISSGSVYRDAEGRTLDEARETGFPRFPAPIGEDQPTVAPGPATYSTRKAGLEQTLLQQARRPVSVLRPFAIHGPGSTHPREWWFVRRILDGRRRIPLAWRGESRFHTTATVNLAELIRVVCEAPGARVLNAVDPEAASVAEIGRVIAGVYGAAPEFVLLDGAPAKGGARRGRSWRTWRGPRRWAIDPSRPTPRRSARPVARPRRWRPRASRSRPICGRCSTMRPRTPGSRNGRCPPRTLETQP